MDRMESQLQLFVSHSYADQFYCVPYATALGAHGCNVWYDDYQHVHTGALDSVYHESGMVPAPAKESVLERELGVRPFFIVLLSPASITSDGATAQMDAACFLLRHGRVRKALYVMVWPCKVPPLLATFIPIVGEDGDALSVKEAVARTLLQIAAP